MIYKDGPYWEETYDLEIYGECDRCGKLLACGEPFWMARELGCQVLCRECRDEIRDALDEDAADTVEENNERRAWC